METFLTASNHTDLSESYPLLHDNLSELTVDGVHDEDLTMGLTSAGFRGHRVSHQSSSAPRSFVRSGAISLLAGPASRYDLSERDSAVVRWEALVPIGLKVLRREPVNRALSQISILKTSATQHHF